MIEKSERGKYADILSIGAVKTEKKIDCVHISFGQLQLGKGEEKEEKKVEHCEPIAHVILSEKAIRLLLNRLKFVLGEKEEGGG